MRLRAASDVGDEVGRWLPKLAAKRGLDLTALLAAFQVLPVRWRQREIYGWLEPWARGQMAGRDEDDWPTLALARTLMLTDDGQRSPIVPLAWMARLPEHVWPAAFTRPLCTRRTVAIWSQDKDLDVSGLSVWKTGHLLRALGY